MSMAITADMTRSKRSPGIDKANKLTYHLRMKKEEGRRRRKRHAAPSCHNESGTYSCRARSWCDDCGLFPVYVTKYHDAYRGIV